ncbi:MAG: hypothetical protein Q9217_000588 [Psora testacea]
MPLLLQDALDGNHEYDQCKNVYIDAEDTQRSISAAEARSTVRKLIAGFKAMGLKRGDCVCIHSFNDVSPTISDELSTTLDWLRTTMRWTAR